MNNLDKTCPMCEEGILIPTTRSTTFEYRGSDLVVEDLEVSTCGSCDSELVFPEQRKKNQVKIADKKRNLDGLLTSHEIIEFRKRYNLSQVQASILFGGGQNAFSKYERGDVIQSVSMDRLLRLVFDSPMNLLRVEELAGIAPEVNISLKILCDYNNPCEYSVQPTAPIKGTVINRKKVVENDNVWKAVA